MILKTDPGLAPRAIFHCPFGALSLLIFSLGFCGCTEELDPPEIWIDISPVNVGARSIDLAVEPRRFDLQLTNRGEEVLVIDSIAIKGDQNCAFEFIGPDINELAQDERAFIRGWYGPTIAADDQIALEINSNCVVFPTLVVPVCGRGVPPGTEDAGPPLVCNVPPPDQPDCPAQ